MPALRTAAGESVRVEKGQKVVQYNFTEDGALAVGANNSDWFNVLDLVELLVQANVTNATGTTAVFVEQSDDETAGSSKRVDHTSADLTGTANIKVNVAYQFARVRAQQATAVSTGGGIAVKASN